jgi:hypothetical protein
MGATKLAYAPRVDHGCLALSAEARTNNITNIRTQPGGLADERLHPDTTGWPARGVSHLAVIRYDPARAPGMPPDAALEFYESAYQAGVRFADRDLTRLGSPEGVTSRAPGR